MSSLADAVCLSGDITGDSVDLEQLRQAKQAVGNATCVIANTGVRPETVGEILAVADGCIVGTALKRDGDTWKEVDKVQVERFVTAAAESGQWKPTTAAY
jgi:predicted TIM-barrel enzyme